MTKQDQKVCPSNIKLVQHQKSWKKFLRKINSYFSRKFLTSQERQFPNWKVFISWQEQTCLSPSEKLECPSKSSVSGAVRPFLGYTCALANGLTLPQITLETVDQTQKYRTLWRVHKGRQVPEGIQHLAEGTGAGQASDVKAFRPRVGWAGCVGGCRSKKTGSLPSITELRATSTAKGEQATLEMRESEDSM